MPRIQNEPRKNRTMQLCILFFTLKQTLLMLLSMLRLFVRVPVRPSAVAGDRWEGKEGRIRM